MTNGLERWTEAQGLEVRACVRRILDSATFAQSERLRRFLSFVATETLAGHADRLKGYAIAVEVFDRDASFDPTIDAIVRVEAARLRAKLREYYATEGRSESVRLALPKGRYAVQVEESPPLPLTARAGTAFHDAGAGDATRAAGVPPIDDRPSLAVLPFTSIGGNSKDGYLADGLTDTLTTELSRLRGLFVVSRHSSFLYRNAAKRAEEIGRELGVKYLVEGSLQRAGKRLRITAQLIDAAAGTHLWAERFDRRLEDIFAVQDDVVRRILVVLQVEIARPEKEEAGHEGTRSIEAHDSLLRGLEQFWLYSQDAAEEARAHFARAVKFDPAYAVAHAWLARTQVFRWIMYWDPSPQAIEEAYEHALVAVNLAPRLPQAHSVLCWVRLWRKQGEAAIAAGLRAVAMDPNDADAHLFLSMALSASGRREEALHYIEKGMRLNPHPSALYQFALGQCYYMLEEYDKAIEAFRRGVNLRNVFYPNHWSLCLIYTLLGREAEAAEERGRLLALTGGRRPFMRDIMAYLDEPQASVARELKRRAGLLE